MHDERRNERMIERMNERRNERMNCRRNESMSVLVHLLSSVHEPSSKQLSYKANVFEKLFQKITPGTHQKTIHPGKRYNLVASLYCILISGFVLEVFKGTMSAVFKKQFEIPKVTFLSVETYK